MKLSTWVDDNERYFGRNVTSTEMETLLMTDTELNRIVPLKQAAELMGISIQTLRRTYRNKFIRLSPRRLGMRVRDALQLPMKPGKRGVSEKLDIGG